VSRSARPAPGAARLGRLLLRPRLLDGASRPAASSVRRTAGDSDGARGVLAADGHPTARAWAKEQARRRIRVRRQDTTGGERFMKLLGEQDSEEDECER
jgi:hypothetical protein